MFTPADCTPTVCEVLKASVGRPDILHPPADTVDLSHLDVPLVTASNVGASSTRVCDDPNHRLDLWVKKSVQTKIRLKLNDTPSPAVVPYLVVHSSHGWVDGNVKVLACVPSAKSAEATPITRPAW